MWTRRPSSDSLEHHHHSETTPPDFSPETPASRARPRTALRVVVCAAMSLPLLRGGSLQATEGDSPQGGAAARAVRAIAMTSNAETVTVSIDISGGGIMPASGFVDSPPRIFLDFPDVALQTAAVTASRDSRIKKIRAAVHSARPLVTRVVIDLAAPMPFRITTNAGRVTWCSGNRDRRLADHQSPWLASRRQQHRPHRRFRRFRTFHRRRRLRSQLRRCRRCRRKILPLQNGHRLVHQQHVPHRARHGHQQRPRTRNATCGRYRRRSTGCDCRSRFSRRSILRSRRIPSASRWRSTNSRGYGRS